MSELPDAASDGRYGSPWHDQAQTRLCSAFAAATSSRQAWQAADKAAKHHRPRVNATDNTETEVPELSRTAFPRLLIGRIPQNRSQDWSPPSAEVQSPAVSSESQTGVQLLRGIRRYQFWRSDRCSQTSCVLFTSFRVGYRETFWRIWWIDGIVEASSCTEAGGVGGREVVWRFRRVDRNSETPRRCISDVQLRFVALEFGVQSRHGRGGEGSGFSTRVTAGLAC